MIAFAIVLSVAAGIAGAVQVAVMVRFGDRIGVLQALSFSTAVTAAIALVALLFVRQSVSGYAAAVRSPPWMWIGGLMGALIVFTITLVAPKLGTFATIGIFIAAQLAFGIVIDRFGFFGLERVGLHWERIVGVVLLAAGAALALKK